MTTSPKLAFSLDGDGSLTLSGWKFWARPLAKGSETGQPVSEATAKRAPGALTSGETGAAHRVEFKIKHWIDGRLRVVIPRLGRDKAYAERLAYRVTIAGFASRVRVTPKSRSLVVEYDATRYDEPDILELVTLCIQDADRPDMMLELPPPEAEEAEFKINYVKRLGLPAVAMGLTLGTFVGLAVPPLLVGGTLLAAAVPSFMRAWAGIRDEKKLNVDFLDSTAIIALTATSIFFPPALMIGLIESGEIIRDMTARRTARANLDLLDALGKTARLERGGVEVEVPLTEVVVGDIVVVYPGDQIPVDGTVLSGVGLVDQQKLTGESIPITREEGQDVLAATLVVDGTLRIEAKRTGENTRAGVVVALMKAAPVHDTRMEDYARKVGDRIVIPTLALGGAVTLATGSIVAGIAVITLDIGTGIRVSVPTAILASLTFAARNGILIRSGRAIEQLAMVDTVVFDKTGTLTQGKAGVTAIYTQHDGIRAEEVLQLAASAEAGLTHPVAEAITRHAREQEMALKECETWEFRVGQGVAATIDGREIYVGSHRMMKNLGVDTGHINATYPEIEASAASQVFVAEGSELLGVILYKDPARPESVSVIQALHELGITPYMLSGDIRSVANAIAAELGMKPENVYAEAFPERKVEVVKELQESGKTIAFVGDGINDSAALAHASVSVSFAGATDMARETADIVLMDDDLSSLILAIRIAKMTMSVVRQNAGIVVGPNLSAMVWAALIGLNPVAAVVINNGSAIAAEMNGFRPLLGPPGWEKLSAERAAAQAARAGREEPSALLPTRVDSAGDAGETVAASGAASPEPAVNSNGKPGNYGFIQPAPGTAAPSAVNGSNGHHPEPDDADARPSAGSLDATASANGSAPPRRRTQRAKTANGANGSSDARPTPDSDESVGPQPVAARRKSRSGRANGSHATPQESSGSSVSVVLEQEAGSSDATNGWADDAVELAAD